MSTSGNGHGISGRFAVGPGRFATGSRIPVDGDREVFGLDQDLEVHDANHVEVKRDYPVRWKGAPGSYVVETFLFFPLSFGVTPDTFAADQLFSLMQSYLRWRDEDFTFDEFVDPSSIRSPLARLERGILAALERPMPTRALDHEARYVGCATRVFLKGGAARIAADLRGFEVAPKNADRLDGDLVVSVRDRTHRFIDRAEAVIGRIRRLRMLTLQGAEVIHSDVVRTLRLVDEYLTVIYEQALAQVFEAQQKAYALQDGKGSRAALEVRLKSIGSRESVYRSRQGFSSLGGTVQQRELYAFRTSLLKKFVSRPLYLDVRTQRPRASALQHVVGAVAAALAAIWAVWVQMFLLANNSPPSGNGPYPPDDTTRAFSAVTSVIFAVAVIAYVLKDRLKAFVNETAMRRLRGSLPDRDVLLTELEPAGSTGSLNGHGRDIGSIREQVRFVAPSKTPREVQLVRSFGHSVDIGEERAEVILHHTRTVDLEPAFAHSPDRAVRDIMRLNVAPFLERLDDPEHEVRHFDDRSRTYVREMAPRVYHLNLVFRLAPVRKDAGPIRYERIRVVLSQKGIVRVEEAVPLGTIEDLEAGQRKDFATWSNLDVPA